MKNYKRIKESGIYLSIYLEKSVDVLMLEFLFFAEV